jgi:hypothetical protein
MSKIISVEYEVLASIRVDVETGKVVSVSAFTEDMNGVEPYRVYAGEVESDDLPEYLPKEHPLFKQALVIADKIAVGYAQPIPFSVRP